MACGTAAAGCLGLMAAALTVAAAVPGGGGTTYLAWAARGAVFVARQASTPAAAGGDVVDLAVPDTVRVLTPGPARSMFVLRHDWNPSPWEPAFRRSVYGWNRVNATTTSLGPYVPGTSAFRVTFTRLVIPASNSAAGAVSSLLPLLIGRGWRQRSPRPRGFAVVPTGMPPPDGGG